MGTEASKSKNDSRRLEKDKEVAYVKRLEDVGESCLCHVAPL